LRLRLFSSSRDSISALPPAAQERTLLPLLQTTVAAADGNLLAVEHWRRTMHSLGSTAPADQLLPLVLWDVFDTLLGDNSPRLSAGQQLRPLLHEAAPQPQPRTTSERPHLPESAVEDMSHGDLARIISMLLSCRWRMTQLRSWHLSSRHTAHAWQAQDPVEASAAGLDI
jgi:hypothetical protein